MILYRMLVYPLRGESPTSALLGDICFGALMINAILVKTKGL